MNGIGHYSEERFDRAIELLEKAVQLDQTYARAWDPLGSAYAVRASSHIGGRADYERTQAALQKAIEINPAQPRPQIFLASLLTETNRVEEAVPRLRAMLAAHPQNALAL